MTANQEIEIKFRIEDVALLTEKLEKLGFPLITDRTHEVNTLYDLPGSPLRRRGALLRVRQYGKKWTITYKDRARIGPGHHKMRREIETPVADGQALADILQASGFRPGFAYEKFRSEWIVGPKPTSPADSARGERKEAGQVLVTIDETPIGNFGEIEGPPQSIDKVAKQLEIPRSQYITASYAELFLEWKKRTGSHVTQMRFPL